jgi:hypothetical protein
LPPWRWARRAWLAPQAQQRLERRGWCGCGKNATGAGTKQCLKEPDVDKKCGPNGPQKYLQVCIKCKG